MVCGGGGGRMEGWRRHCWGGEEGWKGSVGERKIKKKKKEQVRVVRDIYAHVILHSSRWCNG